MDFRSITDPYIPSWVKAEVQGTESLFDCNEGSSMSMGNQQNEQFVENNYSNPNNENMLNNENIQDIPNPSDRTMPVAEENNFHGMPVIEESNLLWPVSPFESGEGLPYAPIDWPNPGDTWTWRVGRRINAAGYFQDRFLYLPKHLPPTGGGQMSFASKAAVENYVKSNFPGADVGAFFSSFSWKIPAKIQTPPKVEPVPIALGDTPQDKTEIVQEDKEKPTPRYSRRERKQKIEKVQVEEEEEAAAAEERIKVPRSTQRKRKQNAATPSSATMPSTTPKRKSREPSRRSSRATASRDEDQQESMVNLIPEDFDNYLNSLEDILAQPLPEVPVSNSALIDPSVPEDEMVKARSKLSSLLLKDFPLLISSKNFSQLTTLASKIRMDPTLTADQLVKLKLIDDIPLFSEVYYESRQTTNQVDKFFTTLEANKAKIASMKNEYSELKDKADQLQSQVDSSSLAVQEIDEQIAHLKARRAELSKTIEMNKAAKVEVAFAQKMVASSIPSVVHEIQVANSRIPEMELKKTNAEKRETEILEKFAPLKGFAL